MKLTIETLASPGRSVTHIWRTGDPLDQLEHAILLLSRYAAELKTPAVVAQMPQLPIKTP